MDPVSQNFGGRVYKVRRSQGLSQDELAEKCGIGRATIATIESGRQSVSLKQAYKICLALEQNLDVLLPPLTALQDDTSDLQLIKDAVDPEDAEMLLSIMRRA